MNEYVFLHFFCVDADVMRRLCFLHFCCAHTDITERPCFLHIYFADTGIKTMSILPCAPMHLMIEEASNSASLVCFAPDLFFGSAGEFVWVDCKD
jgi:hypothetical protein